MKNFSEDTLKKIKLFSIAILIIVLDQLTKIFVLNTLAFEKPVRVFTFLNWTLVYNRGSAFNFLSGTSQWQADMLSILAVVVGLVIIGSLCRRTPRQMWIGIGLSLILGGLIGNLIDRIRLGWVIDFISLHYGNWYFAIFNIGDSAICIGTAVLLLLEIRKQPILPK